MNNREKERERALEIGHHEDDCTCLECHDRFLSACGQNAVEAMESRNRQTYENLVAETANESAPQFDKTSREEIRRLKHAMLNLYSYAEHLEMIYDNSEDAGMMTERRAMIEARKVLGID